MLKGTLTPMSRGMFREWLSWRGRSHAIIDDHLHHVEGKIISRIFGRTRHGNLPHHSYVLRFFDPEGRKQIGH